jgi:hypothetical protein
MREFTRAERFAAAKVAAMNTDNAASLRPGTVDMIAEAWANGENTYSVSCQFAIEQLLKLMEYSQLALVGLEKTEKLMELAKQKLQEGLEIIRQKSSEKTIVVFTPDEIQAALDKNLATGLRQLADAIEGGAIDGKVIDCQGNGFTAKGDDRAHVMLRIDLAAEIRKVLEGESREEFERDRMGQTGEDNARKMFGEKEKS